MAMISASHLLMQEWNVLQPEAAAQCATVDVTAECDVLNVT